VTPTPTGVRRALTDAELAGVFDAIAAATSTGDVLVATINGLYTVLLADLGHTPSTRSARTSASTPPNSPSPPASGRPSPPRPPTAPTSGAPH
jgi:hypothetical protein